MTNENRFLLMYERRINEIKLQIETRSMMSSFEGDVNFEEINFLIRGYETEIKKLQKENVELKLELDKRKAKI